MSRDRTLAAVCPPGYGVVCWNQRQAAHHKGRCPTCGAELIVIETGTQTLATCPKNLATPPAAA